MRTVVQRVKQGAVTVDGAPVGGIGPGLVVLIGVAADDTEADAGYLADKIVNLRIFEDSAGKMNLSLLEAGGDLLAVSQFTLLADCRRGRRPSFVRAAEPQKAESLYLIFVEAVRARGVRVETGRFGAMMQVALVNDGPVTIVIDSRASAESPP
jgi:D-tyrosyl-tRNA(Tyr) deacylase